MFLSDASVRRPVAMGCLIIGLALLGLNAARKIGLELMPKVDLPYVTITTVFPGASPDQIESDIAKRIEDKMVSVDGLKHVSSTCIENACITALEFRIGANVDIAATDVREKLDLIRADFPADVEDPQVVKYDINATPVITLALTGGASVETLYDYADNTLRDRLSVTPGVADLALIGGAEREVQIQLDREELAARGLTVSDVLQAIQGGVRTIPAGRVREQGNEYTVKFDADYSDESELASLELASLDGRRCRVSDVAQVRMTTGEVRQSALLDGRPAIAMKIIKRSDANGVRVVRAVRETVDAVRAELPGGMELVWVVDDGTFIEATNRSAWVNVLQGILLTCAILFLFLYNFRSLLVVSISMPLTIVIGLFFLNAMDVTLNMPTLISIGMSVGILVTNAIVVLEAIVKRLAESGDPRRAAREGAAEAFVPVLASAGTNMVVLVPMTAMSSMMGLFIRPFALTMLVMTVVSLFICFTLTPLLCSLIMKPGAQANEGLLARMEARWNRGLDRFLGHYRGLLLFFEKRRWAAVLFLLLVGAAFLHALGLAGKLGSSMMSQSDRGQLSVKLEFPPTYSRANTERRVSEILSRLNGTPEMERILTTIGKVDGGFGQSSEGVYLGQSLICFSPKTERSVGIDALLSAVRQRVGRPADAIVTVSMPNITGGQGSDLEMEVYGHELGELDRLAQEARQRLAAWEDIQDVDTSVRPGKPEIRVRPSRSVLSDRGITATQVGMVLRGNLEGMTAATFKRDGRNYDVVVKMAEREGRAQVGAFAFPGADGRATTLETLSTVSQAETPIQIIRKDKQRIAKLYANLKPSLPLGTAVQRISAMMEAEAELPPGYGYRFSGDYEIMTEGQGGLAEAALIGLILVVLTLAAIMESFKQPLLILVTLPLALMGVIWALFIAGESLGLFTLMGCVMLIGIVVNNAILIMDPFNAHVADGMPRHKAMVLAASEQFRPIIMITLAAVLGMLPLALGRGLGAESRHSVGIASAGGILVSGILTLVVMPVLYDLFTRRQRTAAPAEPPAPDRGPLEASGRTPGRD